MTIANFNKINLEDIRSDINAALKAVGDKYGMAFDVGRITFLPESFQAKVRCVITNGRPAADMHKIEFEKYCSWYNLRPEHFGKSFTFENDTYTISGLNRNRRRYNVLAKSARSGKEYRFHASSVRQALIAAGVIPAPTNSPLVIRPLNAAAGGNDVHR